METTPVTLLERLRTRGDEEAWRELVSLVTPLLLAWARRVGLSHDDAADFAQDVLLLLVSELPTFEYDPARSFRAWLKAVAMNKWRERHLLEQFTLGLLSDDQAAPLEEHLATCQDCLRTLSETSPSDDVIDALRQAPRTLERRAKVEADIRRVEAVLVAQLRDPYRTHPETDRESKLPNPGAADRQLATPPADAVSDTSPSGSAYRTLPHAPGSGTQPDHEEESYNFLSPPVCDDEIGRLGGYRVLRVLGTGGMGVVFEAEDPHLRRHVALKAMKPSLAANALARKRFLREAQAAASVEHDHIVPIYQVAKTAAYPSWPCRSCAVRLWPNGWPTSLRHSLPRKK